MDRYVIFDALDLTPSLTQVTRQPRFERANPSLMFRINVSLRSPMPTSPSPSTIPSLLCGLVWSHAKDPSEDTSSLIKNILCSASSRPDFQTRPRPTPSTKQMKSSFWDIGKGRTCAVDVEEPRKATPKSHSDDEAFASILRQAMEVSKSVPTQQSRDEAGPSGSSSSSTSPFQQDVPESE